ARPAEPVRTAEGAHPRPGHHRRIDARLRRGAGTAGRRQAAPAGDDAGQLHRAGGTAGAGDLVAVIPAKAGISSSWMFRRHHMKAESNEIPAFAGMTSKSKQPFPAGMTNRHMIEVRASAKHFL